MRMSEDKFSKIKKESCDFQQQDKINQFVTKLEENKLSGNTGLKDREKLILYDVAGCTTKCIGKMHCKDSNQLFTPGKVPIQVSFENSGRLQQLFE